MSDTKIIRIVAAVIRDGQGRVLLVRKRGADVWQQPGGKRDVDDRDDLHTLERELLEELGCAMRREGARHMGRFSAPAANEPGYRVEAEVYEVQTVGAIEARAEIDDVRWVHPRATGDLPIARLSQDWILPALG
ncbi:NUDIX domain-containing protein [Dyella sp. C11]|uniref:NUDIX hydrolase n=1 Tax=Dyella sp. C11 TaxID=2126991 RepID=UPI000D657A4F|nr:NUDIX domain-containing protein [Dyella sp. C11]